MTRVTTTCPQCMTIFRVNPEQLAARRGQVRCGRCRHVFNGYETVSVGPDMDEAEAAPVQHGRATIQASGASLWRRLLARLLPGRRGKAPASAGRPRSSSTLRAEGLTQMADLVRSGPSADRVEPGAMRIRPAFGLDDAARPISRKGALDSVTQSAQKRLRFRQGVRLGLALLLLILPFGLIQLRGTLVALVPASRPLLLAVCTPLNLSVPLPGDAERWSVESHELQADPDNPQLFHLVATLRNRAGYAQAYPAIEVNLTDLEGLVVERLVTLPALYLPADHKAVEGLAGNTEVSIKANIKPRSRGTEGYRLVLFYP